MPVATIFWKYFNKLHWSICLNLDTRPHVWTGHGENWFFCKKMHSRRKKRSLDFKLKFVVLVSWSWSRVHTRSKQVPKHGNGRLQNGQFLTPAKVKVNGVSIVVSMTYWGWLDVCFLWLPCVEELSERVEMLTFLWRLLKNLIFNSIQQNLSKIW